MDADDWTLRIIKEITNVTRSPLDHENLAEFVGGLKQFFYVQDYKGSTYEKADQVPNLLRQAWPYFLFFIVLENLVLFLERRQLSRLNDTITSLSNGLILECGKLLFRGGESLAYVYIYDNLRLVELRWDSALTWYLAALGVDFCYYWVHRASHEVHILWAQHQVHHSSEDFNLAVGLRQSILYGWCGFAFYLPLAFFIPPAQFLTHQQFSLLYQFWIHTETITTLGPLEYVLNTPKHHRVHHGCNKYCLDKNYGGFLIIWDRIFGTFAEEKDGEEIVYGLIFNQPSFNPIHLQTFYTKHVANAVASHKNWRHKVAAVLAGPSWQPGKPRLGDEKDKFDIKSRMKYSVSLPVWCNLYLLLHFCVVVYGFQELAIRHLAMNPLSVLLFVSYILASLTTFGMMFDRHPLAITLELIRCVAFAFGTRGYIVDPEDKMRLQLLQLFHVTSAIWWCLHGFKVMSIRERKEE